MVKKNLETKVKEAVIEIKNSVVEIKKSVRGIYDVINDMTLSLYHVITDRRGCGDGFYSGDYRV